MGFYGGDIGSMVPSTKLKVSFPTSVPGRFGMRCLQHSNPSKVTSSYFWSGRYKKNIQRKPWVRSKLWRFCHAFKCLSIVLSGASANHISPEALKKLIVRPVTA